MLMNLSGDNCRYLPAHTRQASHLIYTSRSQNRTYNIRCVTLIASIRFRFNELLIHIFVCLALKAKKGEKEGKKENKNEVNSK